MKLILSILKLVNYLNIPLSWAKHLQSINPWIEKICFRLPSFIKHEKVTLNNIPLEVFSPKYLKPKKIIFYIHGGGFLLGINMLYRRMVSKIAFEMEAEIWVVDYPLLPDHAFPHALNTCFQAYVLLGEKVKENQSLIIMGDSAGGNLVVSCMHLLKESRIPFPQGVVLFSPWLDLTLSGNSLVENTNIDPLIKPSRMPELVDLYLKNKVPKNYYLASPLYGCLENFPPLFIAVGEHEVLLDDALRFAQKAQSNGIQTTVEIGRQMPHVYPLLFPSHFESSKCFELLKEFLDNIASKG